MNAIIRNLIAKARRDNYIFIFAIFVTILISHPQNSISEENKIFVV